MAASWSASADRFLFSLLPHLNESVHIMLALSIHVSCGDQSFTSGPLAP